MSNVAQTFLADDELWRTRTPSQWVAKLLHVLLVRSANEVGFATTLGNPGRRPISRLIAFLILAVCLFGSHTVRTAPTLEEEEEWEVSKTPITELKVSEKKSGVGHLVFSPDGKWLAAECWQAESPNGMIKLWKVDDLRKKDLKPAVSFDYTGLMIQAIAFSPDGQLLAMVGYKSVQNEVTGQITVWDCEGQKEVFSSKGRVAAARCVAFSPKGAKLVVGCDDGAVHIWDLDTGKEKIKFSEHTDAVMGVDWSPDGEQIVSGSKDGIYLWAADTGKTARKVESGNGTFGVAFHPNGKEIAFPAVRIPIVTYYNPVTKSFVYAPDYEKEERFVQVVDSKTGKEKAQLRAGKMPLYEVAYSRNGHWIASYSQGDGTAWLWDAKSGKEFATFKMKLATGVAVSPDGKLLAVSGKGSNTIPIWSLVREKK